MNEKYADMLHMPHHVSAKHPQMSRYDRAAQFSSFRALTGYEDAVKETARYTDKQLELTEEVKCDIDQKLCSIRDLKITRITVTYFLPDPHKEGGKYVTYSGTLKKMDLTTGQLLFRDGTSVPVDRLLDVAESR